MPFGINTAKRHLDDPAIQWDHLTGWLKTWTNEELVFAGRYFLRGPFQKANPDPASHEMRTTFLWAHGEGAGVIPVVPITPIVPIQAGNADRQQLADADVARLAGHDDGKAVCLRLDAALKMEDFQAVERSVKVFLEVLDGTKLSPDYWAGWATAVMTYMVVRGPEITTPFFPCLFCRFDAGADGKFSPSADVVGALDNPNPDQAPDDRNEFRRCNAFWARTNAFPPAGTPPKIDGNAFADFNQVLWAGFKPRVPVVLWQFAASQEADPGIAGLNLSVGVDAPDMSDWTLENAAFSPTDAGVLSVGIDTDRDTTAAATCLRQAKVPALGIPVVDGKRIAFVGRYYDNEIHPTHNGTFKHLMPGEARALSNVGIKVVSVWESARQSGGVTFFPDWWRGGPYFDNGFDFGRLDGRDACLRAQQRGQPPWTPIYFAVDVSPGLLDMAHVVDYFKGVAKGVDDYLTAANSRQVPYDVGVYGTREVLNAVYPLGVASFFWEIPFNPPADYNVHVNAVQKVLNNNGANICGLGPPPPVGNGGDVNISWGDEGGWSDPHVIVPET